MPGILFLRRRWAIGSDDFVFPSFAEICLRFIWLVVIAALLKIYFNNDCENSKLLREYYIGAIVLLIVTIIFTLVIMGVSMQGTISDDYPRRHINILLYIKFLFIFIEAAWLIYSTYITFDSGFKDCDYFFLWAARGAVLCAWIVGFFMFVGIILVFDPLGSTKGQRKREDEMSRSSSTELISSRMSEHIRVWERRCRCLCCCIVNSQDTDEAFSDVSKLIAGFFKDTDLVLSDIAAGMMLLGQQQKDNYADLTSVIIDNQCNVEGRSNLSIMTGGEHLLSWMSLPVMAHYMKYALGSYGWPFYIYSHLTTGLCKLCIYCRCCACIRQESQVYSDNACECNTAAIKKLTEINNQDLIYVSFHNKYREIPFYVAIDRLYNTVVISIRGTLSLQDALTDVSAEGTPIEVEGLQNASCHSAMKDCAQYIKTQLQDKHILEAAFARLPAESQLVIAGHSLGAGVGAILAVMLRSQYKNLACFAFSPPGGLMSPNLSQYTRDFVCSVIVGEDIVPRLAMLTMCDLKVQLLLALKECRMPKYKILATGCLRMLCSCLSFGENSLGESENSPLSERHHRHYSTYSPLQPPRESFLESALKAAEEYRQEMMQSKWPMHPPGRILHIIEVEEGRLCGSDPQYKAVWANPEDFNRIIISRKMVFDHFPDVVLCALNQLSNRNYVP